MNAADEIFADTANAVESALKEDMDDMAADLRKKLGVPVDRSTKPPTRSKPGEYPRKDTGALQGTVTPSVTRNGDVIEASVTTDRPYDQILIARGRDFPAYIQNDWNRRIEQRQQARLR